MISERGHQLGELLESAIASFDIPDDLHELAIRRYGGVGQWLSDLADERGQTGDVYPQGSFRLGTVVRPIGPRDQYDIDMVSKRNIRKESISQEKLKADHGRDLDAYVESDPEGNPWLEDGKRCWTLGYPADPFHIDVLPAIPDLDGGPNAILLTDKELRAWQHSDPIGYAEWFRARMAAEFAEQREAVALAIKAMDIEDVPEWRVKTTVQRTVQALKRHRDIYFQRRPDDRPASIIITTLAARAYRGRGALHEVLADVTARMPSLVELRDGVWWIPNPVQPAENFADRWRDHPGRPRAFFEWMERASADFRQLAEQPGIDETLRRIGKAFGESSAKAAGAAHGTRFATASQAGTLGLGSATGLLTTTPRRAAPRHTFHGGDAPRLP